MIVDAQEKRGMMEVRYACRARNAVAGMLRRIRGRTTFRRRPAANTFGPTLDACATRACVQKEVSRESKSKRSKAETYSIADEGALRYSHPISRYGRVAGRACASVGLLRYSTLPRYSSLGDGSIWCRTNTSDNRWHCLDRPSIEVYFGLGPRLPARPGLVDGFRFSHLADEFFVGQALAGDLTDSDVEALRIGHLAVVEPERLFVDVAEQVKGLHADIGPVQAALQKRPEVFHRVCVDVPVHVLNGVIDDLVLKGIFEPVVGFQFVGKDSRACFDVLTDIFLKFLFASVVHNESPNVSAALHHAHHDGFIFAASAGDDALAFRLVHVARLTADEGLIDFHFTRQLAAVLALLRESNPVQHEPSGFLSDTKRPRNFATADAVLAIQDEPHCREPLVQAKRGVFENGPNLNRELPPGMPLTALPPQLVLEETDPRTTTPRANNAIFPFWTTGYQVLQTGHLVLEVKDCFFKGLRSLIGGFHTSILHQTAVLRKYIIAQFSLPGFFVDSRALSHSEPDNRELQAARETSGAKHRQ
jgi:hypothetical protein